MTAKNLMESTASISICVHIPRQLQIVSDQIVLGLITGGLIGSNVMIRKRETSIIQFERSSGLFGKAPDRGEIQLKKEESGETGLIINLWCSRMRSRRFIVSALLGAFIATISTLFFGFLIHWSAPFGVLSAVFMQIIGSLFDDMQLKRKIKSYIHNMAYLKSM